MISLNVRMCVCLTTAILWKDMTHMFLHISIYGSVSSFHLQKWSNPKDTSQVAKKNSQKFGLKTKQKYPNEERRKTLSPHICLTR